VPPHTPILWSPSVDWLHVESEPFSLASPRTPAAATAKMAALVDVDQAYGFREYEAIDLEGHLWSFMRPLA